MSKTKTEHRLIIDPARDVGDLPVAAANGALSCSCGGGVWMDVLTPVCTASDTILGPPDTSARGRVETIYPGHRGRT